MILDTSDLSGGAAASAAGLMGMYMERGRRAAARAARRRSLTPERGEAPGRGYLVTDIERSRLPGIDDGVAVVLTTHLMDEAEDLADQVVIVDGGRVIAQGSVRSLVSSSDDRTLRLDAPAGLGVAELAAALSRPQAPPLVVTEVSPGSYTVVGAVGPSPVAALTAWLAEHGVLATRLTVGRRPLADVFLDLTGRRQR